MATECSPDKIVSALHEEAEIITDIVREKIKLSDRLALRMIPDGGTVRRHANNDTVIYGEARQASVQYRDLDHSVKTLEAGKFPGRDLHGSNGIFDAQSNQIDDNACHGQTTIDFSQGYRVRRTIDKGLDLDTPIKCARELDRLGESHIRGYFEGFKNQFTRFGLDNFSDNLLNLTIQYSEANASVIAGDQFNVSTGGWSGVPQLAALRGTARQLVSLLTTVGCTSSMAAGLQANTGDLVAFGVPTSLHKQMQRLRISRHHQTALIRWTCHM